MSNLNRPTNHLWRVFIPLALGTAFSLIGDATMYTVLPTHTVEAGITLASVGIMLSANRWVRLLTNGAAGLAYDRWPRRRFFVGALFLSTLSTALYALWPGFWPLLIARVLWGVAWSGIWVGGNIIILDVTEPAERGRWTGFYQLSFYLGSTLGFLIGGALTDWFGYQIAFTIAASVTLVGSLITAFFLPETQPKRVTRIESAAPPQAASPVVAVASPNRDPLTPATALYSVNRFVTAGIVSATLGLLVQQRLGEVQLGSAPALGVATITGGLLGASTLISMLAAPLAGHWSDRLGNRWWVIASGLLPGILGAIFFALGGPALILVGVPLNAITGGSNQSLATTVLGDNIDHSRRGRAIGWMHTFGDFSSAIAPLLAYWALPMIGLAGLYISCAILLMGMLAWAAYLAQLSQAPKPSAS